MDVSCPSCFARYTADDDKLRGKTARMRCKACNTAWMVAGPSAMPAPAPAPGMIMEDSRNGKRAAVIRRGTEREKRDLFAQREPDFGSVKESDPVLPPPSFGFNGGVGARNENSVLFRVDQLVGAGLRKAPPPDKSPSASSQRTAEDDGIIDLNALASVPPRAAAFPVAPLFSEPPPMTVEVGSGTLRGPTAPRSKLRLLGGIAAATTFLLVVVIGISVAFRSEEPVKHAAALAVPPPPPVVAPPPTAETAPAPPPATVAASDEPAESKDPKGKKGKAVRATKAKGGKVAAPKAQATVAKPVKAADPCGCKGDFNCILACTAKGGK